MTHCLVTLLWQLQYVMLYAVNSFQMDAECCCYCCFLAFFYWYASIGFAIIPVTMMVEMAILTITDDDDDDEDDCDADIEYRLWRLFPLLFLFHCPQCWCRWWCQWWFFNKAKAYSCFVPFACSWSMVSSSLYYSLLNLYDDDVKMAKRRPCLTIGIISI